MSDYGHTRSKPADVHWADKFLSIPGLIVTTVAISTLLTLNITLWQSSEEFALGIKANPTQVAIYVQIISHILGLIQVQVFCAIIRCTFINSTRTREFSLHVFQWVQAASTPRVTFSLPWFLSLSLLIPVIISLMPAAIWSASLTPIPAVKYITLSTHIPTFQSTNLSTIIIPGDGSLGPDQIVNTKGLFAFEPAAVRGLLLTAAADASTTNATGALQSKLDKSAYQYQGRNYGSGAAVGLSDNGPSKALWYRYTESGFAADVTCIYNSSADFGGEQVASAPLLIVTSEGFGPTGENMTSVTYGGYLPQDFFGWGTSYSTLAQTNNSIFLSMWTGANNESDRWGFAAFDSMQCHIKFTPRLFDVYVNNTNKVITVTPDENRALGWPDYGEVVLNAGVANWLYHFTMLDTCVGGSTLGRAMRVNLDQLVSSMGRNATTVTIKAVEDFVASLVDNTLVSLAAARLMISNQTEEVEVSAGSVAVKFGDRFYILVMFAFNCLLCGLYAFEATRTRFWRDMSALDVMNIGSIVVGALKGGIKYAGGSTEVLNQYGGIERHGTTSECESFADVVRLRVHHRESRYPTLSLARDVDVMEEFGSIYTLPRQVELDYTRGKVDGNFI